MLSLFHSLSYTHPKRKIFQEQSWLKKTSRKDFYCDSVMTYFFQLDMNGDLYIVERPSITDSSAQSSRRSSFSSSRAGHSGKKTTVEQVSLWKGNTTLQSVFCICVHVFMRKISKYNFNVPSFCINTLSILGFHLLTVLNRQKRCHACVKVTCLYCNVCLLILKYEDAYYDREGVRFHSLSAGNNYFDLVSSVSSWRSVNSILSYYSSTPQSTWVITITTVWFPPVIWCQLTMNIRRTGNQKHFHHPCNQC